MPQVELLFSYYSVYKRPTMSQVLIRLHQIRSLEAFAVYEQWPQTEIDELFELTDCYSTRRLLMLMSLQESMREANLAVLRLKAILNYRLS
ncbi:hypothetical protein MPTK1_3g17790 [Marchantia polymorpha subsp. ruderalis]|uniref:Uncharacterized protein n=2 Tax=Marchantia polymorpha TaxID=3197 RepID=A0AAF6B1Z2_MARPO|nr:hypothetical protein MARPO_0039s0017 [Marchantia polymorpha]BBN06026.1 hypothetical protein Mp_3g17790 [Marchantia polymorpha subsp. ruderalis]|eukprot:PTQ40502.1 hypothetical protein MARPO_0039s0017 [Marchantia polymorpha]